MCLSFVRKAALQAGSMSVKRICYLLLSLIFSLFSHVCCQRLSRKQHAHCALYSQLCLSVPRDATDAVFVPDFFSTDFRAEYVADLLFL